MKAWLASNVWQLFSWPEWWRFHQQRERSKAVQIALLRRVLNQLSTTSYGQRFGVSERWDYERFRAEVPLVTYEELQPFLAIERGLLHQDVRVWEPTGGSTGGSKWIPWTAQLQREFRRAISVWIFELYRRRPALKRGRGYWQITPKTEVVRPDWLAHQRVGFEGDGDYLGPLGRLLERWVTVPGGSGERFWESTVNNLLAAPDLTLLSCWSPSFLEVLYQQTRELTGVWSPHKWWPNLTLISCWTQGSSSCYEERLEQLFPGIEVQGKGLLSTEAVTTIPLGSRYPVAYRSHFFEFEDSEGGVHPLWDLKLACKYKVIQTTGGGLVRYRSDDWVEVDDYWGSVPCLRFLGRDNVVDHFGEKLSEAYLAEVLARLQRFAKLGFEDNGYVLFLEKAEDTQLCLSSVEEALMSVFSYADCRKLGQLAPLRLFEVEGDAWTQFGAHLDLESGRRKLRPLLPPGVWSLRFAGEFRYLD